MQALNELLETLAAKRAARTQIAAPLLAALKEAQTLHDAAVAEVDRQIAALEEEAVVRASVDRDVVFAKAKTYKHADSVLKLTSGKAVIVLEGHTEESVIESLEQDGGDAARACIVNEPRLNKAYIKSQCSGEHEAWFAQHGLGVRTTQAVTIQAA